MTSKTIKSFGTLDQYIDSLPAERQARISEKARTLMVGIGDVWVTKRDGIECSVTQIEIEDDIYITSYSACDDSCDTCSLADLLRDYEFVRKAGEKPSVIDDTFNDDLVVQTFGDIQWDMGRDEKTVKVAVCLTCDAKMAEDSLDFYVVNQGLGCPTCRANAASKMRLIGIAGPARAGKDTLASYLLHNLSDDWSRSSFADLIKEMLRAIGIDCSDDAKAVVDECFGVTPRHMMQTLGTEWGRNLIDGDIWVKAFARLNAGKCVIVPDVRFENEAELVREHGVLIHLVGRGGIEGNHASENPIDFKPGDIVIDNSRDLAWLRAQVDSNAVLGDFISEVGE